VVEREVQIFPVFRRERGYRQHGVWDVYSLFIGQRAAGNHLRDGEIGAGFGDTQAQLAIVEQHIRSFGDRGENFRVRQWDAVAGTGRRIEVEPDGGAAQEIHRPAFHVADAELGALQIGQNADRLAGIPFQCPDARDTPRLVGVAAVAEIKAKDIRARFEQGTDHLRCIARWAERCHDFCLTKPAHTGLID